MAEIKMNCAILNAYKSVSESCLYGLLHIMSNSLPHIGNINNIHTDNKLNILHGGAEFGYLGHSIFSNDLTCDFSMQSNTKWRQFCADYKSAIKLDGIEIIDAETEYMENYSDMCFFDICDYKNVF
eukprot:25844_1